MYCNDPRRNSGKPAGVHLFFFFVTKGDHCITLHDNYSVEQLGVKQSIQVSKYPDQFKYSACSHVVCHFAVNYAVYIHQVHTNK